MATITAAHPVMFHDQCDLPDDGSDVTDALQQFLASIPSGLDLAGAPSVIDLGGARWHCEKTPSLFDQHNLIIRNGTIYATAKGDLGLYDVDPVTGETKYYFINKDGKKVYHDPYSTRSQWLLERCTNIRFENVRAESTNTVEGSVPGFMQYDPKHEAEHGWTLMGCDNITFDGQCVAYGVWGDGVTVAASNWDDVDYPDDPNAQHVRHPSTNITFERGFTVTNNGRQGISASWVDGLNALGAQITNSKRSAFDLEPDGDQGFCRNVLIEENTGRCVNMFVASKGQGDVSNIKIRNNAILDSDAMRIYCNAPDDVTRRRHDWEITGNYNPPGTPAPPASPRYAIELHEVDNVLVDGNDLGVQKAQGGHTVSAAACGGTITITNNRFAPGGTTPVVPNPLPDATVTVANNTAA